MTDTTAPRSHRRIRSGVAALLCSIGLIAWVVLLVYVAVGSATSEVAGVVASLMFFASWVVVPVLLVALLVLAVIALLLNPVPGKILGAVAIVLPVAAAVFFWNTLGTVDLTQLG